ncbi:ArsR/SmtB family transcription factor [Candidatus Alkanophaga liquidiphilum]|nr:MAG: ArsR family transcriptional regulator [Candidatus Alkanophagales archaeon]
MKAAEETRGEVAKEDEKLLILPLNASKKVSQVLSNDTARRILEALTEAPLSASEVAGRLGLPLTTVQYNVNKLLDAGLVRVERTKYSEKMREVKIYAPARKFVVIVPAQAKDDKKSVIEALKRYLGLLSAAGIAALLLDLAATPKLEQGALKRAAEEGWLPVPAPLGKGLPAFSDIVSRLYPISEHAGFWFFLGCAFVVVLLAVLEIRSKRRKKRRRS